MSKLSASAKGAVFIGLVAILYLFDGRELSMGSVSMPGEGFVPRVMGIFLLACCVALFSKEVFFRQLVGDAEKKEPEHGVSSVTDLHSTESLCHSFYQKFRIILHRDH